MNLSAKYWLALITATSINTGASDPKSLAHERLGGNQPFGLRVAVGAGPAPPGYIIPNRDANAEVALWRPD